MKFIAIAVLLAAFIVPSTALAQTPPQQTPAPVPFMDHNEAWITSIKYMNHHFKSWKLARAHHRTAMADTTIVNQAERIMIAKWIYKGKTYQRTIDITKKGFNVYSFRVTFI